MSQCRECGGPDTAIDGLCLTCQLWLMEIWFKTQKFLYGRHVINGHLYMSGRRAPEDANKQFLGFAGREFVIETFAGERVETNNLSYLGEIPERFRDRLPDDAKFLNCKGIWEGDDDLKHLT